jgi:hypothetical protein
VNGSRLAKLLLIAVIIASGGYLFIYLYRWEWNRATIAGVFLIAAEVAYSTIVVADRLGRRADVAIRTGQATTGKDETGTLVRLRQTAPPPRQRFAWLSPSNGRTSVFVPVLMGAGVVLSGLAWVVERIAQRTARPRLERGLAKRLDALAIDTAAGLVPPPNGDAGPTVHEFLASPRPRT